MPRTPARSRAAALTRTMTEEQGREADHAISGQCYGSERVAYYAPPAMAPDVPDHVEARVSLGSARPLRHRATTTGSSLPSPPARADLRERARRPSPEAPSIAYGVAEQAVPAAPGDPVDGPCSANRRGPRPVRRTGTALRPSGRRSFRVPRGGRHCTHSLAPGTVPRKTDDQRSGYGDPTHPGLRRPRPRRTAPRHRRSGRNDAQPARFPLRGSPGSWPGDRRPPARRPLGGHAELHRRGRLGGAQFISSVHVHRPLGQEGCLLLDHRRNLRRTGGPPPHRRLYGHRQQQRPLHRLRGRRGHRNPGRGHRAQLHLRKWERGRLLRAQRLQRGVERRLSVQPLRASARGKQESTARTSRSGPQAS